jgi:hypothetical protein
VNPHQALAKAFLDEAVEDVIGYLTDLCVHRSLAGKAAIDELRNPTLDIRTSLQCLDLRIVSDSYQRPLGLLRDAALRAEACFRLEMEREA